jgi:hypothetical protein
MSAARFEQAAHRLLLLLERHAVGRQRHQGRAAARQQHQQQFVRAYAPRQGDGTPRAFDAAGGRQRVSAGMPLGARRRRRRPGRADAEHRAP